MKNKIFFLLVSLCIASLAMAQQKFIIKGKLTVKGSGKVMLSYSNGEKYIKDSAKLLNGAFSFSGDIISPAKASLLLKLPGKEKDANNLENAMFPNAQECYLEKGTITVSGSDDMTAATIKGGKTQTYYSLLQSQLQALNDTWKPLQKKAIRYYEKNKVARQELVPRLRAIRQEMEKVRNKFIYSHPDSYVSLDIVGDKATEIDVPVFEPLFNALSEGIRGTKEGKELADKLAVAKKLQIGRPAIDFTQNDTAGMPLSLASLKGKYVLVDFWASWCGPCRAENPNVVNVYNRYKDRNFEIIGVSLDDNKDAWLKAISADKLTWKHVSDLKGWDNEVAMAYDIQGVPQNLLLDTNGIIIGKNLRGKALEKKLEEVMGAVPIKDSAIVKIKMNNPHNYPMSLLYTVDKKRISDSLYVMENDYRVFKVPVKDARIQSLLVKKTALNIPTSGEIIPGPQFRFLVTEGATIIIEGDAEHLLSATARSNNKDITDYETYCSKDRLLEAEARELLKRLHADEKDTSLSKELEPKLQSVDSVQSAWRREFVSEYYQRSYAALAVFNMYYDNELSNDEASSVFGTFPEQYKSTSLGRRIKEKIDHITLSSAGRQIIPFRQEGLDGRMVDIAALKGKVVLIDFWGSWCGYCRAAHPHLKEIYGKYKRKGLEIVGVAHEAGDLQKRNEDWKKAIAEDGINWLQVLNDPDGKDLVKLYGISAFPTKILVDREGNIVDRSVGSGEEFDAKLKELLK